MSTPAFEIPDLLSAMRDVSITNPASGNALMHNGTAWVNRALNSADVGLGNVPNVDATNASNISSGTVATARLGSGTATNATLLRGDGTWSNSLSGNFSVGGFDLIGNRLSTTTVYTSNNGTINIAGQSMGGTANAALTLAAGTYSSSSVQNCAVHINPTDSTTGTGGLDLLKITRSGSGNGSGAKNLIRAIDGTTDRMTLTSAGQLVITNGATGSVPLIVKGAATPNAANLQAWTDSSDQVRASMSGKGCLSLNFTTPASGDVALAAKGSVNIDTGHASNSGLNISGRPSQTGDLLRISSGGGTGGDVLVARSSGRMLLGDPTDDGVNRLQVNGSASISSSLTANTLAANGTNFAFVTFGGNSPPQIRCIGSSGTASLGLRVSTTAGGDNGRISNVYLGSGNSRLDFTNSQSGSLTTSLSVTHEANVGINTTNQFGSGVGVLGIANATTDPTTNPSNGGVLHASSGAGRWRSSGGAHITFAPNTSSSITGSRTDGSALLSLLTYLASLGYITDSTSA